MKNQRDRLHQYQKRITIITDRETQIAKECLRRGDKKRALLALRRKKYQESLLAKTDAQLGQLEVLTSDVEFALVQKDVLFGLQQGTAVLKEMHKEMGGVEEVEKLLGESEEAQAYTKVRTANITLNRAGRDRLLMHFILQEVSELLAGRMSNQDEDEVEDELEALEAELSGVTSGMTPGVKLPDAPTKAPEGKMESEKETAKERARRRQRAREVEGEDERAPEPMLA